MNECVENRYFGLYLYKHFSPVPRILRIINRLNLGGPTFNAALLTRYLSPEYETLLLAGSKEDSEESSEFICRELGISFQKLPEMHRSIHPLKDWIAYRKIRKVIREFKPDIVHTHAAKAGALGRLAAFHEKVPVTVHTFHGHVFHSYFHPLKTRFFLNTERYLAKHSSGIVAISTGQKRELGTKYKVCEPDKIQVIPLGFDLSRFRENIQEKRARFRSRFQLADDELAIGIIGRLVPVKNHALFLEAAVEVLKKTDRKVRFLVIGDGEERNRLLALCRHLKLDHTFYPDQPLASKIVFTSWIHDIDVAMAGLDIIALSSFNEGTPVSLIEAQAAEKPIVSTNVGGIENVVVPGSTALLTENNDLPQFAEAILRLVQDDELRKSMSLLGWDHVRDRFHYTRLVRDMSNLYQQLLKKTHR